MNEIYALHNIQHPDGNKQISVWRGTGTALTAWTHSTKK